MLRRYVKMTLVTIGILMIGSVMVLGCSKGSDNKGISENVPEVTPVTPVVTTCDVCFKDIPVTELCAAFDGVYSGIKITLHEQTKTYVEIDVEDETGTIEFTVTIVPYNPATDAEYQVIKSSDLIRSGKDVRTITIEFRYRNIQIGCNSLYAAEPTYATILSVLEAAAP